MVAKSHRKSACEDIADGVVCSDARKNPHNANSHRGAGCTGAPTMRTGSYQPANKTRSLTPPVSRACCKLLWKRRPGNAILRRACPYSSLLPGSGLRARFHMQIHSERCWRIMLWSVLGFMLCTVHAGCVQRRMTVRTNPPGALLYVDDYPIGTTPISTNFTYYGTRKIRLVKDGYETLTVMQPIPAPWYQFPPIDFVAENVVPGEIRDHRALDFQLRPQTIVPTDQLLSRAEELRRGVPTMAGVPTSPATGGVRGPMPPGPVGAPELVPTPQGVGGQQPYPLPR
jgi:hypothetical protein